MRKIDFSGNVPSRMAFKSRRRFQIGAERLLDNDARSPAQLASLSCSTDWPEQHRRDGEVIRRAAGEPSPLAKIPEGCGVFVVAAHVAQQTGQLVERRAIHAPVFLQAVVRPCTNDRLGPKGRPATPITGTLSVPRFTIA